MYKKLYKILVVVIILTLVAPVTVFGQSNSDIVKITLLHTNDFHGRLQPDSSGRGGSANIAGAINRVEAAVGEENVALMDAGDVFFAAPAISQLLMGESAIDIYNMMGYDLAVFGNHEFDKGLDVLGERVAQSNFPWLGANVVLEGTDWDLPPWAKPYIILNVGPKNNPVKLGVLGLAAEETPEVTLLGTTEGLVFKDLTETVLHYYDEVLARQTPWLWLPTWAPQTAGHTKGWSRLPQALNAAGKPVDLMIGGHQHQQLTAPVYVGNTAIVSAGYYGRWLGRVDVSIDKASKRLTRRQLPADHH